jgi:hypothetical protein
MGKPLLVACLAIAAIGAEARADCGAAEIAPLAPSPAPVLPTNALIAIQAPAGRAASLVPGLALHSEGEVIPVELVAVHEGEAEVSQVLVRPSRPLTPRTEVRGRWTGTPSRSTREWRIGRTGDGPDRQAPRWSRDPSVIDTHFTLYLCGPEIQAVARVAADGDDAPYVEVVVGRTTYLLPIVDGTVTIGRRMCNGEFDLDTRKTHVASLVLVDAAGNRSAARQVTFFIDGPPRPRPFSVATIVVLLVVLPLGVGYASVTAGIRARRLASLSRSSGSTFNIRP